MASKRRNIFYEKNTTEINIKRKRPLLGCTPSGCPPDFVAPSNTLRSISESRYATFAFTSSSFQKPFTPNNAFSSVKSIGNRILVWSHYEATDVFLRDMSPCRNYHRGSDRGPRWISNPDLTEVIDAIVEVSSSSGFLTVVEHFRFAALQGPILPHTKGRVVNGE
ncbi:hypothetical protein AAG570_011739 [Ranatra chinensis]|uniref:Uncharacterized protein n=1 Tax=Ranatra chinensis TaxID=642074 RepID=A0ABD0YH14_9HEMI